MNRRVARAVVLAALAGRLVLLLVVHGHRPGAFLTPDSVDYLDRARALLTLGSYAPSPDRPDEADIVRTPGYPVLLAATEAVAGPRPWAHSIVGALLATGTALALLHGFEGLLGERAACWAATLLCLDPGSFARSLDVLSETLCTLLLVLGLLAIASATRSGRVPAATTFLAGLALAAAVLVRPILVYLPLVLTPGLALLARRRGATRAAALAVAGTFLLPAAFLVGGWVVRNGVRSGAYVLTPVAGHQLLHRRAASVVAHATGRPLGRVQEEMGILEAFYRWRGPSAEAELFGTRKYAEVFPRTASLSTPELDRRWTREAMRIFREHPFRTGQMLAEGAGLLLLFPPPPLLAVRWGLLQPSPELVRSYSDLDIPDLAARLFTEAPVICLVSALSMAQLLALYALAVRGGRALVPGGSRSTAALLAVAALYLVVVSASTDASHDRFRVPLMPIVCLLAGAGLAGSVPRP